MTEPRLLTQWAVCGIAAAAARFVPVPLLDDVIRQRAAQLAVVRTLRVHGRAYDADLVQALWAEREAQGSGLRRRIRKVSRRLLLFPVRKYAALFGAVRGVPTDVLRVVLLARSVERSLDRGALTVPDLVPQEAAALRRAVDEAFDEVDLRMLTAALADGLSQSRGLSRAAVGLARRRFTRPDEDAALDPDAPVAEGAQRVTEVLRRPETAQQLDAFDAKVDALLRPGGA